MRSFICDIELVPSTEMTDENLEIWTDRRTVLKSALLGTVGTLGISRTAKAETSKKITVTQGNQEYTIKPLSYNGETIEEFYDYSDLQSHTSTDIERSDVSELFFYQGPNGLSLCVIHDRAYDGSGGAVTFDFTGLPVHEGSWIVIDDSGDMNSDSTSPDWSWLRNKSDGGVFRGGLESTDTIRIDPAFNDEAERPAREPGRLTDWQLLSGDPSNPERISLDMDQPITISIGESGPSVDVVSQQKLALAEQVTGLAQSIDDKAIASTALSNISADVGSGALSEADAVKVIERLKLGENVTETALAGLGPQSISAPEDPKTLIGAPSGTPVTRSEVSIAKQTAEHVLFMGTSVIAGSATLRNAKHIWGTGGVIAKSVDALNNVADIVFSLVPIGAGYLKSKSNSVADKLTNVMREENIEEGDVSFNVLSNMLSDKIEGAAADMQGAVETSQYAGRKMTMEDKVKEYHQTIGGTSQTSISLSGSQEDAQSAASEATANIQQTLDEVDKKLDVAKYGSAAADILGLAGTVIAYVSAASGVGALVGGVLAGGGILASLSFNFLGAVAGITGIPAVVYAHNDGLDAIMNATTQ